jgi:triosephosphate isomerase
MNKTIQEALKAVKALKNEIADVTDIEILICPSFTSLYIINNEIKNSNINLGAQNIFWETKGSFTGEVSPIMIKNVGCSYVLIGHSERRQYFYETNKTANKKIKAALLAGLIPIVCVGETLREKKENMTFKIIKKQIKQNLVGLAIGDASSVVIAYEPIWAIGTGKTPTSNQIEEIHFFIRKIYDEMYKNVAEKVRIIYGGSINSDNISEFMKKSNIDGGLVGSASLETKVFSRIIKYSRF